MYVFSLTITVEIWDLDGLIYDLTRLSTKFDLNRSKLWPQCATLTYKSNYIDRYVDQVVQNIKDELLNTQQIVVENHTI